VTQTPVTLDNQLDFRMPTMPNTGNANNQNTGIARQNGAVTTTYEHWAQMPNLPNQVPTNTGSNNMTTSTANVGLGIGIGAGVAGGAAALAGVGGAIAFVVHKKPVTTPAIVIPMTTFNVRARVDQGNTGSGSFDSLWGDSLGSGSSNFVTGFLMLPLMCCMCGLCLAGLFYLSRKSKRNWRKGGFDVDDEYDEERLRMMPMGAPYQESLAQPAASWGFLPSFGGYFGGYPQATYSGGYLQAAGGFDSRGSNDYSRFGFGGYGQGSRGFATGAHYKI
jgi:hypothetical protein